MTSNQVETTRTGACQIIAHFIKVRGRETKSFFDFLEFLQLPPVVYFNKPGGCRTSPVFPSCPTLHTVQRISIVM